MLQLQPLLGGAGISSASGRAFDMRWRMPTSVATMKLFAGLAFTYSSSPRVDPTKSDIASTLASHSGWAMSSVSGWRAFSLCSCRSVNCSCTMQNPGHLTRSRPVFFSTQAPRCRSGAKTIFVSRGKLLTIFSALLEVQRVAHEVGEVLDLPVLVVVGQDHRVQLLAEPLDSVEQRLSLRQVRHERILTRADERAEPCDDRPPLVVRLPE